MTEKHDYYYYTNQTIARKDSRILELKIEEETGLRLENPFYDGEAKEVRSLDAGQKTTLSDDEIVAMDLRKIRDSLGIVAYIAFSNVLSIGSWMEIFYCSFVLGKPVYLISPIEAVRKHPWAKYFSRQMFSSTYEFIKFAKEALCEPIKQVDSNTNTAS